MSDANAALVAVRGLTKRFGGFTALDGVSLRVQPGERFGLIGPNGSGKTTLINCVGGALIADAGHVLFDAADVTRLPAHRRARLGIARSFQIPRPFAGMTVQENVAVPLEYAAGVRGGRVAREAAAILDLVGLSARAHDGAASLTQVDMRKLELARALAVRPRLLIVDEAMAGLAHAEVDEILAILRRFNDDGITIVMVEHIMRAVMSFSERVAVLDAGRLIAEGTPQAVMHHPDVERAYLGS